jgi:putative flippase GtrA
MPAHQTKIVFVKKLLRFLLAGLPAFVTASLLNYVLVKLAGTPKPIAYAVVLLVQLIINFFICRYFVFEVHPTFNWWKSFIVFFNGVVFFRLLDWGLYVLLTSHFGLPFLGVQLFNVALFSVLRFEFSRGIFERKS